MSRTLPAHPDLDHLKKQAKDLLGHLRQKNPDARLADAQLALAREYGFSSWTRLKMQLAAGLPAGDPAEPIESAGGKPEPSPFVGKWTANVEKSRRHPSQQFLRATLEIAVAGNSVTIVDSVLDDAGREERRANTIEADGVDRAQGNGFVLNVRWRGVRLLETMAMKDGKVIGRGAYEVSPDGSTLTISGNKQLIVFDRA